ncbi:MAG: septation protein A [Comamonadaceae bacterium]
MKILIDFFPILLFVGAYKLYDIYVGTAVLMAATVLQMSLVYLIDRKLQMMHKITLALILIFGTLTLVLHDERFIKWKPTVLYAAMALALGLAVWIYKKNFLKLLLGSQLTLPDPVWMRLNMVWVVYSAFMAIINGYVAAYYSTEAWVNFKIWGYVFPLLFIVGQGFYIARYLQTDNTGISPPP